MHTDFMNNVSAYSVYLLLSVRKLVTKQNIKSTVWGRLSVHSLTMLLLRFFSTLQNVCGGVSPLLGMMMQMSVTARAEWGWLSGARR